MATTRDIVTPEKIGDIYYYPVESGRILYKGALVALDTDGYLVPAGDAATDTVVGRCEDYVDNTSGADGALSVNVKEGVFRWVNGSTSITVADVGNTCYAVDNNTVHQTSGGGARAAAGRIVAVDSVGVWVRSGPLVTLDAGLLAANNLSDVASAATARTNLDVLQDADNVIAQAHMADNSVGTAEIIAANVTPVKLASGYRALAADAALTLAATDRTVALAITTGTTVATMTATHAGHRIHVVALSRSGGAYTLAASSLTVTLDAAREGVDLVYSGSAWEIVALTGGATAA